MQVRSYFKVCITLASVAHMVRTLSTTPKGCGFGSGQGTHLRCRFGPRSPVRVLTGGNRSMFPSYTNISLSLSRPLSLNAMKKGLWVRIKKIITICIIIRAPSCVDLS